MKDYWYSKNIESVELKAVDVLLQVFLGKLKIDAEREVESYCRRSASPPHSLDTGRLRKAIQCVTLVDTGDAGVQTSQNGSHKYKRDNLDVNKIRNWSQIVQTTLNMEPKGCQNEPRDLEKHSCGTGSKKGAKMLFWADSFPEPFYNKAIIFIPQNHQTTIPPKYGNWLQMDATMESHRAKFLTHVFYYLRSKGVRRGLGRPKLMCKNISKFMFWNRFLKRYVCQHCVALKTGNRIPFLCILIQNIDGNCIFSNLLANIPPLKSGGLGRLIKPRV